METRNRRYHYPLRIVRYAVPLDRNPYQLAFDCYIPPGPRPVDSREGMVMKTQVSRLRFALPVVLALGPLAVQAGDGTASADDRGGGGPDPTRPRLRTRPWRQTRPRRRSRLPPGRDARRAFGLTWVTWQGDPIPIALKVGIERRIDSPEPIAEIHVPREVEQRSRLVLTPPAICTGPRKLVRVHPDTGHLGQWIALSTRCDRAGRREAEDGSS